MLRSALVGNIRLLFPKIGSTSSQESIAIKLHHAVFLSTNSKICRTKNSASELSKISKEVPLSLHQFRQDIHLLGTYRYFSDSENVSMPSSAEIHLINILKENFPSATDIEVHDISGGCGAMYEIFLESPDFKGMRIVKQHQMVTEALKGEIKDMHGLRISTVPSK